MRSSPFRFLEPTIEEPRFQVRLGLRPEVGEQQFVPAERKTTHLLPADRCWCDWAKVSWDDIGKRGKDCRRFCQLR